MKSAPESLKLTQHPTVEAIRILLHDGEYRGREDPADWTIHCAEGAITVLLAELDRLAHDRSDRSRQGHAAKKNPHKKAG